MSASGRRLLEGCLEAALAAVDGRSVVAAALAGNELPRGCPVLAVGKAAPAMLAGARDALADRIGPALCITRADSARPGEPGLVHAQVLYGDHPVPGTQSLEAGRALLTFLDELAPRMPLLCLWSGGSSALVEVLPPGLGAAELARANRWLLASGLPIDLANRVRARLSCLKAGRLAQRLHGRQVLVLAISDVPGDAPAVIGSGPWTPSAAHGLPGELSRELPAWLAAMMEHGTPEPAPGDTTLAAVDYRVIANGARALEAAGAFARDEGLAATLHAAPLQGQVEAAAGEILAALAAGPAGLHAWSGETTVQLPRHPGQGGRNSHLALTLACALAGRQQELVLCAATDGSDGTGEAAGGWADGELVARGAALGRDAREALAQADSGSFLAATGAALVTGPTGTNVMDMVLARC
jgi:glycerate 2-kinase